MTNNSSQNPSAKSFGWLVARRILILTALAIAVFFAVYAYNYWNYLLPSWMLPFGFIPLWLIGVALVVLQTWMERPVSHSAAPTSYTKEQLQRTILSRYQKRFWVSFGIYSLVIVGIIILFFILKDSRVWYSDDPLFMPLYLMKTLFPLLVVLLWVGGAAILLFRQWRQSAADIVSLVDSIEQMQTGAEGDRISVPENAPELEPILQNIFDHSWEDRKAAQEAEQKKNDLILYLAHDLKTPLTSVLGYLTLLEDSKELSEAEREKYLAIARDKALRLEDLIEQFFEISRFSLHEMELNESRFDLRLLLTQMAEEFYPLIEGQGRTLQIAIDNDLTVYGDADKLARVFNNILKNAVAYSDSGSTLELIARAENGYAEISITNEGATIPQDQLDSLFEKFFRLDEARTSDSGGAGLGLAIAKEIVMRHNGTITAESADGKTTFTVKLPR